MTDTPAAPDESLDPTHADPTPPDPTPASPDPDVTAETPVPPADGTPTPTPTPTPTLPASVEEAEIEIERLRSERDALAAQVEVLKGPPRQGRIRSIAVGALVVLLCISFLASMVGVFAKRNALNNEVFASRVAPLGADPAVQAALSTFITAQVMQAINPQEILKEALPDRAQILSVPLANAVEGFIGDQVTSFVASDRFETLWAGATTQAHATAVKILEGDSSVISADNDEIVVNLIPVINEAFAQIGQQSPEIFGRTIDLPTLTVDDIPSVAKEKLSEALGVPLSDDFGVIRIKSGGGALSTAQSAVKWFVVGVWALVILTILLVPFILWLSRRRRRTLLQMIAGLLIVTVLLRRVVMTLQSEALGRMQVEVNRAAAESVLNQFLNPLFSFTLAVLWGLVILGAIALVTGPYAWAVYLRHGARQIGSQAVSTASNLGDRATSDDSIAWLRTNFTAMQVAGAAVGFVLLVWLDMTWFKLFLLALIIGGYELGLWWVAGRDRELTATPDGADPTTTATESDPKPPAGPSDTDVVATGTPF